jgi:transposase-like protein
MPQAQLPFFPSGSTEININLAFEKREGRITYFNGTLPVFSHDEDDRPTFLMIVSQFYVNGNATQAELCRAFGVPAITLKRAVKKYREQGTSGFYKPRHTRGTTILTPEVLTQAQELLNQGEVIRDAAKTLGIKSNTLNKAVLDGRLHKPVKKRARLNTDSA